jgi:hypothetical protein
LESIEDSRTIGEIDENKLRARIEEAISMIQKQILESVKKFSQKQNI